MEIKRWSFELCCTVDMKVGIRLRHNKTLNVDISINRECTDTPTTFINRLSAS